jgi:hypothetical protein
MQISQESLHAPGAAQSKHWVGLAGMMRAAGRFSNIGIGNIIEGMTDKRSKQNKLLVPFLHRNNAFCTAGEERLSLISQCSQKIVCSNFPFDWYSLQCRYR